MKNHLITMGIVILIIISFGLFSAVQLLTYTKSSIPKLPNTRQTGIGAKLTLLFIPVDWTGGPAIFNTAVETQAAEIIDNLPLSACPEEVRIIKINTTCKVGFTSDPNTCDTNALNKITACARATGENYDYVIGLGDKTAICGTEGGYSEGIGTIFVESPSPITAIHELGHELGLNDEYVDACRCQYGLISATANCLNASIGGSDSLGEYTQDYCAGGNQCPKTYAATCLGNLNAEGGRCIMSYANAPEPRRFCKDCLDYLSTIPALRCTT